MSKKTPPARPGPIPSRRDLTTGAHTRILSEPHDLARKIRGPVSQLEVLAACLAGDDLNLSAVLPYADAELPNLFEGTGTVMGFTQQAIHASTIRVLHAVCPDAEYRDEQALTECGFALGFIVAARLFGGVR
ncbi:MAG: hypothetical protein R2745_03645 [Vicinamibacterales bacterium]